MQNKKIMKKEVCFQLVSMKLRYNYLLHFLW